MDRPALHPTQSQLPTLSTKNLPYWFTFSMTLNTRPQAESKDFAETEQEHSGEYKHEHSHDDVKYAAS